MKWISDKEDDLLCKMAIPSGVIGHLTLSERVQVHRTFLVQSIVYCRVAQC